VSPQGSPSAVDTGEGEWIWSGAGSRCTAGQGARPEPPKRAGQGQPRCSPREGAPQMWVLRGGGCPGDAEEGCTRGHQRWVALPLDRDGDRDGGVPQDSGGTGLGVSL